MKKTLALFLVLAVFGFIFVSCSSPIDETPGISSDLNNIQAAAASGSWISELDKELAAEIQAISNSSRSNASGPAITSGAHSADFPGLYCEWDSGANSNAYLKVESAVFDAYENFTITSKEANTYWDFLIAPQDGQQLTQDGYYVFFLPSASNHKINMVFISEQTEKENAVVPPPPVIVEPGNPNPNGGCCRPIDRPNDAWCNEFNNEVVPN